MKLPLVYFLAMSLLGVIILFGSTLLGGADEGVGSREFAAFAIGTGTMLGPVVTVFFLHGTRFCSKPLKYTGSGFCGRTHELRLWSNIHCNLPLGLLRHFLYP